LEKSFTKQVDTYFGMKVQTISDITMWQLFAKKCQFLEWLAASNWPLAESSPYKI
jgi:hypothetical protein